MGVCPGKSPPSATPGQVRLGCPRSRVTSVRHWHGSTCVTQLLVSPAYTGHLHTWAVQVPEDHSSTVLEHERMLGNLTSSLRHLPGQPAQGGSDTPSCTVLLRQTTGLSVTSPSHRLLSSCVTVSESQHASSLLRVGCTCLACMQAAAALTTVPMSEPPHVYLARSQTQWQGITSVSVSKGQQASSHLHRVVHAGPGANAPIVDVAAHSPAGRHRAGGDVQGWGQTHVPAPRTQWIHAAARHGHVHQLSS